MYPFEFIVIIVIDILIKQLLKKTYFNNYYHICLYMEIYCFIGIIQLYYERG